MTPPNASSYLLPLPRAANARPQANRMVAERLRARKRRVAMLRKRVISLVVAMFMALWAVIFVQLASGHDPALVKSSAAKAAAVAATTKATAKATTTRATATPKATSSAKATPAPSSTRSKTKALPSSSSSSGTTASSTVAASSGSSAGNATTAVTTSQS